MAFPTPVPNRNGQTQAVFNAALQAFLDYLPGFETAMTAAAAALNFNSTNDTSTTSNTIGTGNLTFTVSASKSFYPGMYLTIADAAAPTTNSMGAQVVSYSGTTLVVTVLSTTGSGTKASWTISQSAGVTKWQPAGAASGSGATWTIPVAPAAGATVPLSINGVRKLSGIADDVGQTLTLSGTTITASPALGAADVVYYDEYRY